MRQAIAIAAVVLVVTAAAGDAGRAQDSQSAQQRVTELEAELDTLEREIGLLEDSKAIKRLQRAYGYYVDKGLSREVAELFSRDATAEIGGFGVFVGKARVAELYSHLLGDGLAYGQLNNHMIMQGIVDVDPDGTTAKGRWRALIQLGRQDETAIWSEGPYENEYVKEDGVWRISKLHWYMTLAANYSPGWHLESLPMGEPLADLPPDRPPTEVYGAYPSSYLPVYHYDNPVSGRPARVAP